MIQFDSYFANGLKPPPRFVCCFFLMFFSLRQVPQKDVKENPEVIGEFGGIETEVKTDFATRVWVIKAFPYFHHLN